GAEHQLGDQRCAAEAAEVGAELLTCPREVERRERVQVAPLLDVQRRDSLGERLEDAAEAAAWPEGAPGDGGAHAVGARGQAQDLAGLAVREALENDRLDADQRHGSTGRSVHTGPSGRPVRDRTQPLVEMGAALQVTLALLPTRVSAVRGVLLVEF